jgi:hypothetical protein
MRHQHVRVDGTGVRGDSVLEICEVDAIVVRVEANRLASMAAWDHGLWDLGERRASWSAAGSLPRSRPSAQPSASASCRANFFVNA